MLKKCPVCNSTRIRGNSKVGYKCYRCSWKYIPEKLRKQLQESKSDIGITKQGISSQTITNSTLFQEIHDHHHNSWKFPVTRFNPDPDLPRQKGFDGKLYRFTFKGRKIAYGRNWLIIYKSKRHKVPLKDLHRTEQMIIDGLRKLALEIAEKYDFEISPDPVPTGKNVPEIKTPFLSAINFIEPEVKAVYPVPSPIELTGKNAVNNAINLSEALVKINESIQLEIYNKQLHQKVLEDMSLTLGEIRDHVSVPEGIASKLFNFFGLLSAKVNQKTATLFKQLGGSKNE